MTKQESGLMKFASIQSFFNMTCRLGYFDTIDIFKEYFFQGFEWFDTIESKRVNDLELMTYSIGSIQMNPKEVVKPNESVKDLFVLIRKRFINKLQKIIRRL